MEKREEEYRKRDKKDTKDALDGQERKENLDSTDDPLEELHKKAKEQALEHFKKKTLGKSVANIGNN